MPTSIPYDHPSLVLGNIVDPKVMGILKTIAGCQSKIDAAQDKLNSMLQMKRSMAMTMNELMDMNIDITELKKSQPQMDTAISQSATEYLSARISNETQIRTSRDALNSLEIQLGIESPVDFRQSQLKTLPLASESLKLDSQYFSFGSNAQDDTMASIEKYVRDSTGNLGSKSEEITKTVSSQVNQQVQNHSLAGTLIITASCTHSNVRLFEPLVIDPDKAVAVWNTLNKGSRIDTAQLDPKIVTANAAPGSDSQEGLTLLTGASYGSSFVGMVHVLNSETSSMGSPDQLKNQLEEKLKLGGWLENAAGGFGVAGSVMNEIKSFLSTQSVSSHVSVVVMGAIPSIASNKLKLGLTRLAQPDPEVATQLLTDNSEGPETVNSDAEKSRNGARLLNIQNARIESLVKGLGTIDHEANNVLDINSMMSAFENYLEAIKNKDESVGVPVGFQIKNLSKPQIEALWKDKYYPSTPAEAEPGKEAPAAENDEKEE